MRLLKLGTLLLAVVFLSACGGDGDGDDDDSSNGGPVGGVGGPGQQEEQVSFTTFVKDVFDNPRNSEPVPVNSVNLSFEDNNDPTVYDDLL